MSGLTLSEVYPKALFLALFFSMFLLMIFFTFWISPLSTIMLMITPCLMLTQILTLIHTLQQDCTSTLQWFNINQMKANPSKFEAISFGKRGTRDITNLTFENTTIHCENSVVLLGIEIDHSLTFNTHR